MSNAKIREAVLKHLREHPEPTAVSAVAVEIRKKDGELRHVSDFDVRSTVLRMMANGDITSTSTNRITASHDPLATRG